MKSWSRDFLPQSDQNKGFVPLHSDIYSSKSLRKKETSYLSSEMASETYNYDKQKENIKEYVQRL